MKKFLIILVSFIVVFLGAVAAIPLFVKVDQYRPKLLQVANEHLNGKLDLGELNLSVWGTLKVRIEGLKLVDAKGQPVVSVKEAFVQIPWTSILGGAPLLTFVMDHPELAAIKGPDGKLNVLDLVKKTPDPAKGAADAANSGAPGEKRELPGFVTRARLGVDVSKAKLTYRDLQQKSDTTLTDLDLRVKDLSLSRETEIEVAGEFSSEAQNVFKVSGPFRIKASATPTVSGGEWTHAVVAVDGDFSDLEIRASQAFYKKKGMPAKITAKFDATPDTVDISSMKVVFFNAEVTGEGKVTGLKEEKPGPSAQLSLKSNRIELSAWNELIPALNDFSLSGNAGMTAEVFGPSSAIQYKAAFDVKDFRAKSPLLKAEPLVNLGVSISTDKVERMFFNFSAPGNDLSVEGSVLSFKAPKVDLTAKSASLDLDQLVNFAKLSEKPKAGVPAAKEGEKPAANEKVAKKNEDLDALLDPLRKNEILRNTSVIAKFDLKMVKAYEVRITDISSRWTMKDLVASIDSFGMKVFDGAIQAKFGLNMKPKAPTYNFSTAVTGLDLQKAVASQMQLFKDTVIGKLTLKMDGNGASLNTEPAKQNLNAKGTLRVENAVFQVIDIGKMAADAINKAIDKVGETIPGIKGKQVKGLDKGASKYDALYGDFTITGGRLTAPNFVAKAAPEPRHRFERLHPSGADRSGAESRMAADRYLQRASPRKRSRSISRAPRSNRFSANRDSHSCSRFPSVVSTPLLVQVTAKVPEALAKVALNNTKKGATAILKKQGTEKLQDAGKKLFDGLFKKK